ncbi:MAG: geranyl transferase [Gammaproteobacteria bacterium]|jgi:geranylgeranyl pyrophosphate synthase|nr:geranyl transferase [Gammaproteobacteria bacterium]
MDVLARIERVLDRALALPDPGSTRLREAMRYSVLGGGKRLRPQLVYAAGLALGAEPETLDDAAAAVELIHVYSLVHDDLPAMDDDDLRRGRPTCHRAFDEATAILAGDALQALAFEIVAGPESQSAEEIAKRLVMTRLLARGIGTQGMAGGQAIDLEAVGHRLDLRHLQNMHRRKTGALIETSVLLGAAAAGEFTGSRVEALQRYGTAIGIAFQIQDDILDVTGTTADIGKVAGADAARDKPTYTSLLGLDGAKRAAEEQHALALESLRPLGAAGAELARLANFVVGRGH